VLLALIVALTPHLARAQNRSDSPTAAHGAIGSSYGATLLADLPTSDNLFALIETLQPSIMSDRFSQGGLFVGQPSRLGGFLASYTQTVFRLDGVDITDPTGSGAPLITPDLPLWDRVDIATGLMPADLNATGLAISLTPRQPTDMWTRTLAAGVSQGVLTGGQPGTDAPAIARPDGWNRASLLASGPLGDRARALFAGTWNGGAQFNRAETASVTSETGSGLVQVDFDLDDRTELRTLGFIQRASSPFDLRVAIGRLDAAARDTSVHLQSTLDRRESPDRVVSVFGAYTRRARSSDGEPAVTLPRLDRITEGAPSAFASAFDYTVSRWSAGVRVRPQPGATARRHRPSFGVEIGGSGVGADGFYTGLLGESVGGVPARLWTFSRPAAESQRSALTLAVDAADSIRVSSSVTIAAGVRFDTVSGSAEGAGETVSWATWLPRVSMRWAITETWRLAALAGYARSAYRLPLDLLAIGDPNAPTAEISQWDGATAAASLPLVARVGPGTGGDPAFSRIDPDLARPISDELVLGIQAWPHPTLRLSFIGVVRRESSLLGLVNDGAPASSYDVINVEDGGLFGEPALLPVYNRRAESFGLDRYLLTSPEQDDATFEGFEIGFTWVTTRVLIEGGLTASIARGPAGNRGFRVDENDQSVAGELWSNPNAATFATGRLFSDRAYTGKLASVITFPSDIRLGVIARYQDGQPFSRIVVVPNLNQGAEGVSAYEAGGTRFTFTGTVDLRLQKGFRVGGSRVDAIFDVYNLPNLSLEVEEDVVTGPTFREISAVQPPRSMMAGIKWEF
jgi:hypothetical protein